jgi:DNA gyrase subunit B
MTDQKSACYVTEDIVILKGLEPVRLRPGMYLGGTDSLGLQHVAFEALDALASAEFPQLLSLHISGDSCQVLSTVKPGSPEVVRHAVTSLHAGGDFVGSQYRTWERHGVGLAVVNAVSEKFTLEFWDNKTQWRFHSERGVEKSYARIKPSSPSPTGTKTAVRLQFKIDRTIFAATAQFDAEKLAKRMETLALLCAGLNTEFKDGDKSERSYCFPRGIVQWVEDDAPKPTVWPKALSHEFKWKDAQIRVALQASSNSSSENVIHGFVNTVPVDSGSHIRGLNQALTRVPTIPRYGVHAIICVDAPSPQFQGPTRQVLAMEGLDTAIRDELVSYLSQASR